MIHTSPSDQDKQRKSLTVADKPEKKMESDDERLKRLQALRAAEKEEENAKKAEAAKKGGLAGKALELYTKALGEKQSLTLIPAGKTPKEDKKAGVVSGNHLVEIELVDGKPVEFDGMVVVRHL